MRRLEVRIVYNKIKIIYENPLKALAGPLIR